MEREQTRKTIRKQVQTCLPASICLPSFGFCLSHAQPHFTDVGRVLNASLMLVVTLGVCALFIAVYVGVFHHISQLSQNCGYVIAETGFIYLSSII